MAALGMQSIQRGLDWEHSAVERDTNAQHEALYGESGEATKPESGAMGDINLGDVTYHTTVSPASGGQPSGISGKTKAMIAAAITAAALAGGGAASMFDGTPDVPAAAVDADTISTIEVDR